MKLKGKKAEYVAFIPCAGLPHWLSGRESACNTGAAGNTGSIPGSESSPGEGHGNPLQDSCLENPMDIGTWWVVVHGVTKSRT